MINLDLNTKFGLLCLQNNIVRIVTPAYFEMETTINQE